VSEESSPVRRTVTVTVRSVLVVVVVIGLGASGFFIWRVSERQDNQAERHDQLRTEVGELRDRLTQSTEASVSDEEQAEELRRLRTKVILVEECLPEFQAEINSLTLDYGFISPNDLPSARCDSLLYGDIQAGD
jgi:uncharacterized protein HemX